MSRGIVHPEPPGWEMFYKIFLHGAIVGLKTPGGLLLTAVFPHLANELDPRADALGEELRALFGWETPDEPETPGNAYAQPWEA